MQGRTAATVASILALAVGGLAVPGADAARRPDAASSQASAKPFLDVRVAAADRADARDGERTSGLAASAATRSARAAVRDRLGARAAVSIDPLTGTPRSIVRLDDALGAPASGDRAAIAGRWVRGNAALLGLDADDLDALDAPEAIPAAGGLTVVRYGQSSRGIPAFDRGLQIGVDRLGRVVSASGAPRHDAQVADADPAIGAAEALRRLMTDVDVVRDVQVVAGPDGARAQTRFTSGDSAQLVLFGTGELRLAWHLSYEATSTAVYDAVVDARTGQILYRANLVKFAAAAKVFPNYPGAPSGGTAQPVDLEALGYVPVGAPTLSSGRFARTFSDLDDLDTEDPGESINRTSGSFTFTFMPFTEATNRCDAARGNPPCGWNHAATNSWMNNRQQDGVQAHWFVSNFHDHLAEAPIGFTAASGAFEDTDPVVVHTDDGADTSPDDDGPDDDHVNNANMYTPRNGLAPTMQMYLFDHGDYAGYRDINGGDDAATVYHEYTHGLTSRLVTNGSGDQALSSRHAGAMGEAWSDWYAEDYLVRQGLEPDTAAVGEVDIGKYSDAVYRATRSQALDCPVGSTAPRCPGRAATGTGGYTFGDFGRIVNGPEVHADGEIWAETLWDLRTAAIASEGGQAAGSNLAEALITGGLRLSPPEPSFLDMRDAILAADQALYGGAHRVLLWDVFRQRGMGFYAQADNGSDVTPTESFANAPPTGSLRVPGSARTGQPVTFDASASADADGAVASYAWDFDGNGSIDRETGTPTTAFAYAAAGNYAPQVTVTDANGGRSQAGAAIAVADPPPAAVGSPTPAATPTPTARTVKRPSTTLALGKRTRRSVALSFTPSRTTSFRVRLLVRRTSLYTKTFKRSGRQRLTLKLSKRRLRKGQRVTVELRLIGPGGATTVRRTYTVK